MVFNKMSLTFLSYSVYICEYLPFLLAVFLCMSVCGLCMNVHRGGSCAYATLFDPPCCCVCVCCSMCTACPLRSQV